MSIFLFLYFITVVQSVSLVPELSGMHVCLFRGTKAVLVLLYPSSLLIVKPTIWVSIYNINGGGCSWF